MKARLKRWFSQCISRNKEKRMKTVVETAPTLVLLRSTPDSDQSSGLHRLEYDGSVFSPTVATPTAEGKEEESIDAEDAELLLKEAGVRYHIEIFHDGENCQIRLNTDGSLLFDVIIRNVLRAIGCEDADTIDIDAFCDVHWRFVLPIVSSQLFPTRPLRDLLTRGVVHINPGGMIFLPKTMSPLPSLRCSTPFLQMLPITNLPSISSLLLCFLLPFLVVP